MHRECGDTSTESGILNVDLKFTKLLFSRCVEHVNTDRFAFPVLIIIQTSVQYD